MAERHADELTLLAYVDGELGAGERSALEEHLEACAACAAGVRRLEAGREALRGAPLLELPQERRREILASLPERKEAWSFLAPLRRLGPALPAAAALLLVATVVALATQLPGGGDEEAGQEGGEAAATMEESAQDRAGEAPEAGGLAEPPGELVARVEGPAGEVVRLLRRSGRAAFLRDGSVVVVGDVDEIRSELAQRPPGRVAVYARD